jgi:hypothetical protein
LIKLAARALVVRPELLPHIVGLEEVAPIEELDAFQISRIVSFVAHAVSIAGRGDSL